MVELIVFVDFLLGLGEYVIVNEVFFGGIECELWCEVGGVVYGECLFG